MSFSVNEYLAKNLQSYKHLETQTGDKYNATKILSMQITRQYTEETYSKTRQLKKIYFKG